MLRAGVPGQHPEITDDTITAWDGPMSRFPRAVVMEAAAAWIEREPRFPALTEFITHCQATAREALYREIQSGERAVDKCPNCHDGSGWVETSSEGRTTMRPCERCRPDAFERWSKGHYGDDHECGECRDVRKTHRMPEARR